MADEGATEPVLGAEPVDGATCFRVASGVAERIELCLFDPDGIEYEVVSYSEPRPR